MAPIKPRSVAQFEGKWTIPYGLFGAMRINPALSMRETTTALLMAAVS
jgi:hypothetical protein